MSAMHPGHDLVAVPGRGGEESPRRRAIALQLDHVTRLLLASITRRLIERVVASTLVVFIFILDFLSQTPARSATSAPSFAQKEKPKLSRARSSRSLTHEPPQPYRYDSFMQWLRATDFSQSKFNWQPESQEFDIDAAASRGKFAQWLEPSDEMTKAVAVMKGINKFIFMDEIMRSGDLTAIGGPGTHLYVLKQLLPAATGSKRPTFIDAGCGPGILLLAWVLAAGPGSQAIGLELDAKLVDAARRHLANPDAFDTSSLSRARNTRLEVCAENALCPDLEKVGVEAGSVDAINVGLAVAGPNELKALAKLLREGGLLIAPIRSRSIQPGESCCAGALQVFVKAPTGNLVRRAGDPDIPVNFVVGHYG